MLKFGECVTCANAYMYMEGGAGPTGGRGWPHWREGLASLGGGAGLTGGRGWPRWREHQGTRLVWCSLQRLDYTISYVDNVVVGTYWVPAVITKLQNSVNIFSYSGRYHAGNVPANIVQIYERILNTPTV